MAAFALSMTVGDQRRVRCTATWPVAVPENNVQSGDPYNLAGAQRIWFTAKAARTDDDSQAAIRKDTDLTGSAGITVVDNTAYFDIVPSDTAAYANIARAVKLFADLQVKAATGEIWTVAEGTLVLNPQVTYSS